MLVPKELFLALIRSGRAAISFDDALDDAGPPCGKEDRFELKGRAWAHGSPAGGLESKKEWARRVWENETNPADVYAWERFAGVVGDAEWDEFWRACRFTYSVRALCRRFARETGAAAELARLEAGELAMQTILAEAQLAALAPAEPGELGSPASAAGSGARRRQGADASFSSGDARTPMLVPRRLFRALIRSGRVYLPFEEACVVLPPTDQAVFGLEPPAGEPDLAPPGSGASLEEKKEWVLRRQYYAARGVAAMAWERFASALSDAEWGEFWRGFPLVCNVRALCRQFAAESGAEHEADLAQLEAGNAEMEALLARADEEVGPALRVCACPPTSGLRFACPPRRV